MESSTIFNKHYLRFVEVRNDHRLTLFFQSWIESKFSDCSSRYWFEFSLQVHYIKHSPTPVTKVWGIRGRRRGYILRLGWARTWSDLRVRRSWSPTRPGSGGGRAGTGWSCSAPSRERRWGSPESRLCPSHHSLRQSETFLAIIKFLFWEISSLRTSLNHDW